MKAIVIIFLFRGLCFPAMAQVDMHITDTIKSGYKNLPEKKIYSALFFETQENGKTTYEMNGIVVNKKSYFKYFDNDKNFEKCKPCILKTYNIDETLLSKGIQYTDCPVGFWIEYFPNGKAKVLGHYKEYHGLKWEEEFEKDSLCKKDGVWTYFNEKGNLLYSELWKSDQFLKQSPEQTVTEIADIHLLYNGKKIDKDLILSPWQVKEITIAPVYKNRSRAGLNLSVNFIISGIGHKSIEQKIPVVDFKNIDVIEMAKNAGFNPTEFIPCEITVCANEECFLTYFFKVKQ